MGLRDKHKADRQDRILKFAARLFRKKGYEGVKIEEIAAAAEVSVGTIYNYYKNKGDILVAIVAMEVNEVLDAGRGILAAPPRNPLQAINALVEAYVGHSLVYLSKEMWRQAMAISTHQSGSPAGVKYSELDVALTKQVCALLTTLRDKNYLVIDVDTQRLGEIIFNNTNMMFIGFVKNDGMTVASLLKTLQKQHEVLLRPFLRAEINLV